MSPHFYQMFLTAFPSPSSGVHPHIVSWPQRKVPKLNKQLNYIRKFCGAISEWERVTCLPLGLRPTEGGSGDMMDQATMAPPHHQPVHKHNMGKPSAQSVVRDSVRVRGWLTATFRCTPILGLLNIYDYEDAQGRGPALVICYSTL